MKHMVETTIPPHLSKQLAAQLRENVPHQEQAICRLQAVQQTVCNILQTETTASLQAAKLAVTDAMDAMSLILRDLMQDPRYSGSDNDVNTLTGACMRIRAALEANSNFIDRKLHTLSQW